MNYSLRSAAALALAASAFFSSAAVGAADRSLPMHFELRPQGPSAVCGTQCKVFIAATGAITADTPSEFLNFANAHNLAGATVVLDSDGGSVHGAITLGREIRRLRLDTTVGRLLTLPEDKSTPKIVLSPRADCESMCAFVLLAGVRRTVPADARVMVHQIWLGDRREDPTAANYSAEDLVLVQRDIGRLARYTAEMGASIDMLDLSLRIPPWEPMHAMTRDELLRMKVATDEPDVVGSTAAVAATTRPRPPVVPADAHLTDGVSAMQISEQRWSMVDKSGAAALARSHPLTTEGDDIGNFDLLVSCGAAGQSYDVSYLERRHAGEERPLPAELGAVTLYAGGHEARLKVVSSEHRRDPDELITFAAGPVPADFIDRFAAAGNHSLLIETESEQAGTTIRIGNTGAKQNLPRLVASCVKPQGERAELSAPKTGGLALK